MHLNLLGRARSLGVPDNFLQWLMRKVPGVRLSRRLLMDAVDRPAYAFGVMSSALQAKALGLDRISIIEFGCAGGKGLIALEKICAEVQKEVGVSFEVYGFDCGQGLPAPRDYRDLPYCWKQGDFPMNYEAIKAQLKLSKIVLGPVGETVRSFTEQYSPAPIGFISFDLDYYFSTMDAFVLLDEASKFFLPRVFCYFDDCISGGYELHSQYAGELLAINDFNKTHPDKKIDKIYGLKWKRLIPAAWNDVMHVFHNFSHPDYNKYILDQKDQPILL